MPGTCWEHVAQKLPPSLQVLPGLQFVSSCPGMCLGRDPRTSHEFRRDLGHVKKRLRSNWLGQAASGLILGSPRICWVQLSLLEPCSFWRCWYFSFCSSSSSPTSCILPPSPFSLFSSSLPPSLSFPLIPSSSLYFLFLPFSPFPHCMRTAQGVLPGPFLGFKAS